MQLFRNTSIVQELSFLGQPWDRHSSQLLWDVLGVTKSSELGARVPKSSETRALFQTLEVRENLRTFILKTCSPSH